jgi:hypothetical protein
MPMMRRAMLPILALTALAACGRKGARSADFDSATAVALANGSAHAMAAMPKVPHVVGFELAHRLDRRDMIYGGPAQQFLPGDSILLSVRVIYVDSGSSVSARLRQNKNTLDSAGTKSGAKDSAGTSTVGLRFAQAKPLAKGTYQADVFLNGTFQMSKDFRISP